MTEKKPGLDTEPTPNQNEKPKDPKDNPYFALDTIKTGTLSEISFDLAETDERLRSALFERISKEGGTEEGEVWAKEALELDQPLSPEEQEQLVSLISDPYIASEVLSVNETIERKFTPLQREKLMTHIESDEDVAYMFYVQITEAGIEDPSESEAWLIDRLEKVLVQTENPEYAEYLLDHSTTLSDSDREKLANVRDGTA